MRSTLALLALACLFAAWLPPRPAPAAPPEMVGGPCRYDVFPGTANFVSITPWQPDDAGQDVPTPYPPLTVTYRFTPSAPIAGEPLYKPGQTQTFTLTNGMPPGPRYLAKHSIAAGQTVPCELHIIRHGTCTPTVHVFPGIDRADYFELEGN